MSKKLKWELISTGNLFTLKEATERASEPAKSVAPIVAAPAAKKQSTPHLPAVNTKEPPRKETRKPSLEAGSSKKHPGNWRF